MGNYSILKIGPLVFQWKYHIPSVLTFLFDANDFYSKPKRLKREDDWYEEIGYSTTCGKSLNVLNRSGYNIDFFAEVYDAFYDVLQNNLVNTLQGEFYRENDYKLTKEQIDDAVRKHLKKFPLQSRSADLRDFVAFLHEAIPIYCADEYFKKYITSNNKERISLTIPAGDKKIWPPTDFADFEGLQIFFFDKARLFSPSVIRVALLFEEEYLLEYPEIILLMYARLVLEATPKNFKITLDLSDIAESVEEVKLIHSELGLRLTKKLHLYNRVFKILSEQAADVRERYIKTKTKSLLFELPCIRKKDLKGRLLEEMISAIFASHPGLQIVERRYSTSDEEIDLIIKNNLSKPFWIGLSSPMIFVECKNWQKVIGTKEIRNFEIKIQNHRPLVRVGFFIAPQGFSRECCSELRRISRDDYTVVLLDLQSLHRFVESSLSVSDWLEERICHPI